MEVGDEVLISGLTSEAGGQLNGLSARVTQLANDSGRVEVSCGQRLLRLKAENLRVVQVDDGLWAPGDEVRLVGLQTASEELQKWRPKAFSVESKLSTAKNQLKWLEMRLNSCLGLLRRRLPGRWEVEALISRSLESICWPKGAKAAAHAAGQPLEGVHPGGRQLKVSF